MPKHFKIDYANPYTNETRSIAGSFPDHDWRRMSEFVVKAERLRKCKGLQTVLQTSFGAEYRRDGGLVWATSLPADEELAAVLHLARPFVLQRSQYFVPAVAKLLKRMVEDEFFHEVIGLQVELFTLRSFGGLVRITACATPINSEATFQAWVNSQEYHWDSDKDAAFRALHHEAVFPLRAGIAVHVSALADKILAALEIARIITFFGSGGVIQVRMRPPRRLRPQPQPPARRVVIETRV